MVIILKFCGIFIYKNSKRKISIISKIIDILTNFVWIIHHTIFIIFSVLLKRKIYQNYFDLIIILGVMAIFTVLIGVLLEIIKFIIFLVLSIKGIFKIIINLVKNIIKKIK